MTRRASSGGDCCIHLIAYKQRSGKCVNKRQRREIGLHRSWMKQDSDRSSDDYY